MSYTMTHLVIADQYTKRHGMTFSEAALFLLASFSPDSVHADANFHPAMKGRSHFNPVLNVRSMHLPLMSHYSM